MSTRLSDAPGFPAGRGPDSPAGRSLRPFRAVIFDMDGVIVDSEPLHDRAWLEVFAEMGMAETHGIHLPDYCGRSDRTLWLDFIAKHKPRQSIDELTAWKQNRLIEILREAQPIFDGLPDLVEKVSARWPVAVASGSLHPVIDEVLAMKNLRRFFPVVVSVQDVGKSKPAPDVFLRAAEMLNMPAADCLAIEDSAAGVESARSAGMQVIAITNSMPREQLTRATRVVESYQELEQAIFAGFSER